MIFFGRLREEGPCTGRKEAQDGGVLGGQSNAGNDFRNSQSLGSGSVGVVESDAPTAGPFRKDGRTVSGLAVPEPIVCAGTGTGLIGSEEPKCYWEVYG